MGQGIKTACMVADLIRSVSLQTSTVGLVVAAFYINNQKISISRYSAAYSPVLFLDNSFGWPKTGPFLGSDYFSMTTAYNRLSF